MSVGVFRLYLDLSPFVGWLERKGAKWVASFFWAHGDSWVGQSQLLAALTEKIQWYICKRGGLDVCKAEAL